MGYEFFGEKITFPSAPVPGINNDQSLKQTLRAGWYEQADINFLSYKDGLNVSI